MIFEALSANIRFLGLDSQATASPLAVSNATGQGELNIAQSKEPQWLVPSLVPITLMIAGTAGKGGSLAYSIPISPDNCLWLCRSPNQLSDVKFIKIDTQWQPECAATIANHDCAVRMNDCAPAHGFSGLFFKFAGVGRFFVCALRVLV